MKISVITPSLNQGQYIEEAILSVINQNYNNFEHIIMDGGSTDNTLQILKKYPHINWESKPDKGQSDALNQGFLKATGDWILWLNADDIMFPDAFKNVINAIENNNSYTVVHGNVKFIEDITGKLYRNVFYSPFKYINLAFLVVVPPTTGTFFRADYLKKNLLNVNYHYMMDAEWYLKNGKEIFIKNLNLYLVRFRISQTNKTSSNIKTGVLNEQMQKEYNSLYSLYTKPYFRSAPVSLEKFMFSICQIWIKNIIRIKKIKYIFHIHRE